MQRPDPVRDTEAPQQPELIRLIVADDHAIVREGLVIILDHEADMTVVGHCGDGRAAVELVMREKPHVAVLDLQMPVMNGVAATQAILKGLPDTRILILTTFEGEEDIHRAMEAGAHGYVLKDSQKGEVLLAIREIATGRRYLSPSAGAMLATPSQLQQLTTREREVLQMIASGMANKQIGWALNVSEGTVKSHVNAITQKLGVSSRVEAALKAHRSGLLRDEQI